MAEIWVPLLISAAILLPLTFIIVVGLLVNRRYPDQEVGKAMRGMDAHTQALSHLGEVMLSACSSAQDPQSFRTATLTILQILEYPEKGNVGDWEKEVVELVYRSEHGPENAWERILEQYFEFARVNLYCGFVKDHNVAAYERVRALLAEVGIKATQVTDLKLGRL